MKVIFIALFALLVSSCASTTTQIKESTLTPEQVMAAIEQPLPQRPASFGSVFDSKAESARVILVDSEISAPYSREKNRLMQQLSQSINLQLGDVSGVIVKKDLSSKLKKELRLSEGSGKEIGRQDIDFALVIGINSYTMDKNAEKKENLFSEGFYLDCDVDTELTGWFRLVEIPSMRIITQIEFNESDSESENIATSKGCNRIYTNLFSEAHQEITSSAACKGVDEMKPFLNATGHVLEKDIFNKKLVYKTSLTSLQGVQKGDSIELSHIKNSKGYAKGKIIKITPTFSLIKINSLAEGDLVFANDFVKSDENRSSNLSCLF